MKPLLTLRTALASAGVLSLLTAGRAFAAESAIPPVDAATRRALIERVADLLEHDYFDADTGRIYAKALREDLKRKTFDKVTDAHELARQLTRRLTDVHDDAHLRIAGPDPSSPLPPTEIDVPRGPRVMPDSIVLDSLPPDMREMMKARMEAERRVNHYFHKVEILPGNIGYLDVDQIPMLAFAKRTADAAVAFLGDCDAVILDLRDNPGGVEGLNQYLVSHFFPADRPVHLYSRFTRPSGDTLETWSRTGVRATDLSDRPLFVLINGRTGSAAENISFSLKGLHRATLIGERTSGGAHSSVRVGLPGRFQMILPISRVFNPRTGRDWERVGVLPDVPSGGDSALAVAHGLAIDSLIARGANAKRRDALEQARMVYRVERPAAAGTGVVFDATDYVGSWGLRRVWSEDGKLWLQRQDDPRAPKLELIPTGTDAFMIARANKPLHFERDAAGHVVRMRFQTPLDTWELVERKAP